MQLVIRRYRDSSDKDAVLTLFSDGLLEHINPCFYNAITRPLYLSITLSICAVGYLLSFVLWALVLAGGWMGFVYCCCYEYYADYVRGSLRTDMLDIPANYLTRPDDCFWVAEAEVNGRSQLVGTVAVVAKQSGTAVCGELFRMIISPSFRRSGLGSRMTQTGIDFCKERGFASVVLTTSSTHTAAVALYKKMGFNHVLTKTSVRIPEWMVKVTGVTLIIMEKRIQD